jgi:Spy/CpxP family protein refolding chaperone
MKANQLLKRTAALAAATLLGTTLVFAAGDGGGPWTGIRDRIQQRLVQAGMTAEQRDQVREVLKGFMPEVAPLVKQSIEERKTLRDVIRTSPPDEAAIRAQSAKVAAIEAEIAVKRSQIVEKVRPIFTPEQLGELKRMEEEFHSKINEGLGKLGRWIEGN